MDILEQESTLVRVINLLQKPSAGKLPLITMSFLTAGVTLNMSSYVVSVKTWDDFPAFQPDESKTAEENVALPQTLWTQQRKKKKAKVAKLLDLVGLDRAENPSQLSGGQKAAM